MQAAAVPGDTPELCEAVPSPAHRDYESTSAPQSPSLKGTSSPEGLPSGPAVCPFGTDCG